MTQAQPESPTPSPASKPFSPVLLRWAGYGLLVLTTLDLFTILFPPRFTNPIWEFETMGAIVERVPVPLLAAALIFFGEMQFRSKWERPVLKFLSWVSMLFGIFLLLLVPLGVTNTLRLNSQSMNLISNQFSQQLEQVAAFEKQINDASAEQIKGFLESQGVTLEGDAARAPKEQMLSQLSQFKERMQEQVEIEKASRRNRLMESSAKWNLSALISGFLFIYIWHLTRWARSAKKKRSKASKTQPAA
jgi:predicted PurR-regulated permease PerM